MSMQPVTDRDLKVQVLSLEYETLRADMLMRTSSRYQFLGFVTAAAAILATGAGHLSLGPGVWFLAILAGGIFLLGLASFWYQGTYVARMSMKVAEIENRINDLVPVEPGKLLGWESDHQRRSRFDQWVLGHRSPERRIAESQTDNSRPADP
jgi:hypothetical protein